MKPYAHKTLSWTIINNGKPQIISEKIHACVRGGSLKHENVYHGKKLN